MNFFSIEFFLAFILFFLIYHFIKNVRYQNYLLLAFNVCILYYIGVYVLIILSIFAFFVHYFALFIYTRQSKYALLFSVFCIILNLAFFKYFPELKSDIDSVLMYFNMSESFNFLFPVGLSFYTFNAITYLYYVYKHKEVKSFLELFTYLSFFPTLTAGPIFRANNFFDQYYKTKRFAKEGEIITLLLFATIKQVLFANYLGISIDEYTQDISSLSIVGLLDIVWMYSLMLYFDFSAYVDLVKALALMLGYTLPKNFDMPYTSTNIKEFWQKWHISLSSFFKDFVYIPLGGSKNGFAKTQLNVFIVFLLSGIWHDNTLNFALWGALHGLCLVLFNCWSKLKLKPLPSIISKLITFNMVSILWVFFKIFNNFDDIRIYFETFFIANPVSVKDMVICFIVFTWFFLYQYSMGFFSTVVYIFDKMYMVFQVLMIVIILSIVFILMPDGIPNFIYSSF